MEPSLVTLQYCLLVGTLAVAEADVATEAICSAIACRITQLMDLPRRLNPNHLERELEIRGRTGQLAQDHRSMDATTDSS